MTALNFAVDNLNTHFLKVRDDLYQQYTVSLVWCLKPRRKNPYDYLLENSKHLEFKSFQVRKHSNASDYIVYISDNTHY